MAPTDTTFERRHSFSSISLAKEEAAIGGNGIAPVTPRKRTGLNRKRVWLPALAVYLASVVGASYGFFCLGWNKGWDAAIEVMEDWTPVHPINGYLTDVDGSRYYFNKDGIMEGISESDEKDRVHSLNNLPIPTHPLSTGYFGDPNWRPYTEPPSSTVTERKTDWVEARVTDGPAVIEEAAEVTGADSEFHKRGISHQLGGTDEYGGTHHHRGKNGEFRPPVGGASEGGYPPYAIGDEPYGYAGNGDRYISRGVRQRPPVAPQYTEYLEIPAGPDAHLVNPTTNGGLRFFDPFAPHPTRRIWDAPIPDAGGYLPPASFLPDPTTNAQAMHHHHSTGSPKTLSSNF